MKMCIFATCCKIATVPNSCIVGKLKDTRTGPQDLQDTLREAWDLPEAASDHHNKFSQGPGTFRALSEGPGTFRKQRQTTGDDSKINKIIKITQNGLISFEMG